MNVNVGKIDRVVRIIVGIVLIAAPFTSGYALFDSSVMKFGAIGVGVILLLTSMMRICPLYTIFGIRTCRSS